MVRIWRTKQSAFSKIRSKAIRLASRKAKPSVKENGMSAAGDIISISVEKNRGNVTTKAKLVVN